LKRCVSRVAEPIPEQVSLSLTRAREQSELEARRNTKGLTKNGKRPVTDTASAVLKRYLRLETEASLRKKAHGLSLVRLCASSPQTEMSSCRAAVTS
jgi:hypothetical protein